MNLNAAYKILGLKNGASVDDAKSAFKKLALKHHPDQNQNDKEKAEKKFKEINEAVQRIEKGEEESTFRNPFSGFTNPFKKVVAYVPPVRRQEPVIIISLTFEESILGCSKEVNYIRYIGCKICNGMGSEPDKNNKCTTCSGKGSVTSKSKFANRIMQFVSTCHVCNGSGHQLIKCKPCKGSGTKEFKEKNKLQIPPGISNEQVIRVPQAGNLVQYRDDYGFVYGDAYIKANIEQDEDMKLEGQDVISTINIDLLEALKGINKKVRTVKGEMTLKIRKAAKNKTIIRVGNYGVGGYGAHLFNINVEYPENTKDLIEFLEKDKEDV